MRDVFLQLAVTDLFRARWSVDIHREWIDALLRNEPRLDKATLERTRDRMDEATRDCVVEGYQPLIHALSLPDSKHRHVLAAAIVGRCDVIVTQNLKDFPATALAPFNVEAQHPDEFLCNLLNLAPGLFCSCIRKVRARLVNPPYSVDAYLATLRRQSLVATVGELQPFAGLL